MFLPAAVSELFSIRRTPTHEQLQGHLQQGGTKLSSLLFLSLSPGLTPNRWASPLLLLSRSPGTLSQIGIELAAPAHWNLARKFGLKEIRCFKALVGVGLQHLVLPLNKSPLSSSQPWGTSYGAEGTNIDVKSHRNYCGNSG